MLILPDGYIFFLGGGGKKNKISTYLQLYTKTKFLAYIALTVINVFQALFKILQNTNSHLKNNSNGLITTGKSKRAHAHVTCTELLYGWPLKAFLTCSSCWFPGDFHIPRPTDVRHLRSNGKALHFAGILVGLGILQPIRRQTPLYQSKRMEKATHNILTGSRYTLRHHGTESRLIQ